MILKNLSKYLRMRVYLILNLFFLLRLNLIRFKLLKIIIKLFIIEFKKSSNKYSNTEQGKKTHKTNFYLINNLNNSNLIIFNKKI
jgi:hypothetical protein